jgi:integrase
MAKLTKRFVECLSVGKSDTDHFDDLLQGFGVRVRVSGRKFYFVRRRTRNGQRRVTIGPHGPWTTETARTEAMRLLGKFAAGHDPGEERAKQKAAACMSDLGQRFIDQYVQLHLKPTTQREYTRAIKLFVTPRIGELRVAEVVRNDVAELHHALREVPYQANRVVGVLSVWGLRPEGTNPCRGIKKYKEHLRERFLSADELGRLGVALAAEHALAQSAINCFRLLILTGCRLSEIQKLKWEYVDLSNSMLHLPDSKTGKKTVYLGSAAVDEFKRIARVDGNPHVIWGFIDGQYLTDLQHPWRRVRKAAGLEDVRIHDLRHTFASKGVALGQGLSTVGKLLGHTQAQTTARYAHLAADHSIAAADAISRSLAVALR